MSPSRTNRTASFTLVEVMMAATILVVGFIGMIEAMTLGSGMMDQARRQTVATQLINHEIEQLRLVDWATVIDDLTTTSTWSSSTNYAVGAIIRYQGAWYICLVAHQNQTPPNGAYWSAYMTWTSGTQYRVTDIVSYGGTWYRCIVDTTSAAPSNASYWTPYVGPIASTGTAMGATYTITRSSVDLTTDLREITVIVSWRVNTSRRSSSTNTVSFSYTRSMPAYFGKYGLNLSNQRS